jgi:raffinose/stachyose/melibiose transport system permease protein
MRRLAIARRSLAHLTAGGVGLIVFAPIYLVFVNALKTRPEASSMGVGLPTNPVATSRPSSRRASSPGFGNSMLYSVGATVLACCCRRWPRMLARHRTRRHRIIYLLDHGHRDADELVTSRA